MNVRAATWNLQSGGKSDANFEQAVAFLAQNPVDVLVVTEAKWRQKRDDTDQIIEDTRWRLAYMAEHMRNDGASMLGKLALSPSTNCHIATFYNADLLKLHSYDVRNHGIWHVRSSVRLSAKEDAASEAIRFVGVHAHPFDGADRIALAHLNRGYARKRAVILGDFNETPESFGPTDFSKLHPSEHATNAVLDPITGKIVRDENGEPITDHRSVNILLEAGFIDAAAHFGDQRPTNIMDNDLEKRIDLILSSPLLRDNIMGYGLLGDPRPKQAFQFGDHLGVWADFNL